MLRALISLLSPLFLVILLFELPGCIIVPISPFTQAPYPQEVLQKLAKPGISRSEVRGTLGPPQAIRSGGRYWFYGNLRESVGVIAGTRSAVFNDFEWVGFEFDVRRFHNAKALAAFIGVTPRQRESGSSVRGRTMMSRTGHHALRHALYMPGLVARRHNLVLKSFGDRLSANGMAPKAVVGAVMRKLTHLIYGVIHSGQPFDANFSNKELALQDGI